MGIYLNEIFEPRSIILNLDGKTKEEVFNELVKAIADVHSEYDYSSMLASLWERENKLSTGIGSGIAIPHAFYEGVNKITGAIGISQTGIEYNALDQKAVNIVFMLIIGRQANENHLYVLNQLSTLAKSEAFAMIIKAQNKETVMDILSRIQQE
jgi:nitrogen PTS system EIIA component